ncbi:MAG: AI-2E family transporter [Defluviitaleaceae bacterium]|nr:AI-2E family transporter [Defluviitaleaceae bacterium]
MRRLMGRHEFKSWLAFLLLAVAAIVIFHAVSQIEVFWGWVTRFFWIVSPFIWGFMVAYALNIPRERLIVLLDKTGNAWVQKRTKGLSVVLIYVILVGLVWLLSWLVFPRVIETIADLIDFLPTMFTNIQEFLISLSTYHGFPIDFADIMADFSFEDVLPTFDTEYLGVLFDGAMAFMSFLFRFAISIISSIYFMVEGEKIRGGAKRVFNAILPNRVYEPLVKYGREINTYFKRYIYCQVLDAIILGTIMTIVLSLLGTQYGLALGPMLGFANLIPYFGAIIGTIAAVIVIFVTDGATLGFVAGIIMVIIQQIDANYIFPRIIGGSMKISPLLVIIGITVGNAYFGIVGMIVAIPIVTVLRNIIDDLLIHLESKKSRKHEEV